MAKAYQEVAAPPGKVRVVVWRLDANETGEPLTLSEYGAGHPTVHIVGQAQLDGSIGGDTWERLSGREFNPITSGLHRVNEQPYKIRPRAISASVVWLLVPA